MKNINELDYNTIYNLVQLLVLLDVVLHTIDIEFTTGNIGVRTYSVIEYAKAVKIKLYSPDGTVSENKYLVINDLESLGYGE